MKKLKDDAHKSFSSFRKVDPCILHLATVDKCSDWFFKYQYELRGKDLRAIATCYWYPEKYKWDEDVITYNGTEHMPTIHDSISNRITFTSNELRSVKKALKYDHSRTGLIETSIIRVTPNGSSCWTRDVFECEFQTPQDAYISTITSIANGIPHYRDMLTTIIEEVWTLEKILNFTRNYAMTRKLYA